jgi:benzodiazapine receptor
MKKDIFRQSITTFAILAMITINILANALPLNGQNTGAISDRFHIFFVPAGYVFAIWGIIYIGLIGFMIYQALPGQRQNPRLQRIGYLPTLAAVANIGWIFLWHYNYFNFTLIAMVTLLVSLLLIYLRLDVGKPVSRAEKWLVNIPHSVYLGWITVATIANVSQFLYFNNWDGFGIAPQLWTAVILVVAVLIAALMALLRRDAGYLLVLVWAFIGIAVKFPAEALVSISAWAAAGIAALLALYSLVKNRKNPVV